MKNTKYKKIIIYGVIIITCLAGGFFIGRATIKSETKIEVVYKEGETIHDTVKIDKPIIVAKPVDTAKIIEECVKNGIYYELFPEKIVTEYIEITKEDTSAILQDWASTKTYSENLFDIDTLGKCDVDITVQYNRLSGLEYTYTPIQKTTTITTVKTKLISPFVGVGIMTNPVDFANSLMPSANVGIFIKEKYGINLQYSRYIKNKENIIGISFNYKW